MKNRHFIRILTAILALALVLTGCSGFGDTGEVTYKSLFVESSYIDLEKGTFTETENSCVFVVSDVDEHDTHAYLDVHFLANAYKKGFNFGNSRMNVRLNTDGADGRTELFDTFDEESNTFTWLRYTYCNGTLVMAIGEQIPTESECWALAGLSEELIPEPAEDLSMLTAVPQCDSVYLTNKHNFYGTLLEDGLRSITLTDMTMELVNDYVQAALDMGYVEEGRGTHSDTSVETFFFLGRTADNVTLDLYYCGGYAEIQINAAGRYSDSAATWQRLAAHTGKLMGDYEEDRDLDMMMWVYWEELIGPYILDANYGARLYRGTGLTTEGGGYLYRYCVEATEADYNSYIAEMEALGYTLGVEDTAQDGTFAHTACRECDYNGETFWLWEVIRLEGDFLFCSVGFAPMDAELYPADPRLTE